MKLHILMSTYNGEEFLEAQLRSIQAQTVTDWTLLIRDDGSSDRTPDIVARFASADSRIRFVNPDDRVNLGIAKSFHALAHLEDADFYFFSDQDDVWLPNKMQLKLEEAVKHPTDVPLLVYTDLKVVDKTLNVLSESMIHSHSGGANTDFIPQLSDNTVTGNVMVANRALIQLWNESDELITHDWYLGLLAASCGRLLYIDIPTQLYRQHGRNAVGVRRWSKERLKLWLNAPVLLDTYWKLLLGTRNQARGLLDKPISDDKRRVIEDYLLLFRQPLLQRAMALKRRGFRRNVRFHTFAFRFLILTGLFRAKINNDP